MKNLRILIIPVLTIMILLPLSTPVLGSANPGPPPDPLFLTDNKGRIDNFLTNHQILIRYDALSRIPDSKSMDLEINFTSNLGSILDDKEHLVFEPGKSTTVIWKFTPTKAGNYTIEKFSDGVHTSTTFFSVISSINSKNSPVLVSPLRQYQFGIAAENVECAQNLVLLIKKSEHSPTCVKSEDVSKFTTSGWNMAPATGVPQLLEQIEQPSGNTTVPASFVICDTPYESKQGFIPVLYMPANSDGRICVNYWNPNHPRNASLAIVDAKSYQVEKSITTWAEPDLIPVGNSTVTYTIKAGNQTGFYGVTVFCVGMPFAIGYDNNSNISINDFPWEKQQTTSCPMMDFQFKVMATKNIGIKYIPYP